MIRFTLFAALMATLTLVLLLRPWHLLPLGGKHGNGRARLPSKNTALVLILAVPIAAGALYAALGSRAALEEEPSSGQAAAHGGQAADVERMVQGLADRLERNPDDPKGWAMLARSWKVMGRYAQAEQAFARAGKALDQDPDLLTEYADVVAMRNGGQLAGKAADLANKALALDPDHPTALWMAGTAAYQRKDYATARRDWERLLQRLPADTPDREVIRANLEEIRILAGGDAAGATATSATRESRDKSVRAEPVEAQAAGALGFDKLSPNGEGRDQRFPKTIPAASATPAVTAFPASPAKSAPAASAIRGTVRLAPALADKVAPDDAVFVFARATEGPRMPLAVLRARAADLPLDFVLDSSNAMNPDLTLDKAGAVVVEARVSKHGDTKLQAGDMSGRREGVKTGARHLEIVVDKVQ